MRLRTFGTLSIIREAGEPPANDIPRRPLAMVAVIATEGSAGVSRDRLLALFWPEQDPERARHSLDQALYTIRRGLSSKLLVDRPASIELDPTLLSSDVQEFKSAIERGDRRSAVDIYSGPFLDGLYLPGAGEFDRWVEEKRAALSSAHVRALIELGGAVGEGGDHALAVKYCRRAAASDPLSSVVVRALMLALYRAGDSPAALDVARVHTALVRAELEADADSAIVKMAESMRNGTFQPPPPRAPAAVPGQVVERRRGLRAGDVVDNLRVGITTTATRLAARLAVRTSRVAMAIAFASLIVAVAAVLWAYSRAQR